MKYLLIVGLPSGGTSAVAGVFHRLGINMGLRLAGAYGERKYSRYEDLRLHALQKLQWHTNPDVLADGVVRLATERQKEDRPVGGKLPWLVRLDRCTLGALERVAEVVDLIRVHRPLEDVKVSYDRYEPNRHNDTNRFVMNRWKMLESLCVRWKPRMVVDYNTLVGDTGAVVAGIVAKLGLEVTPEQVADAVAFVSPEKQHVGR